MSLEKSPRNSFQPSTFFFCSYSFSRPAPIHRQFDGTSQCKIRYTSVQLLGRGSGLSRGLGPREGQKTNMKSGVPENHYVQTRFLLPCRFPFSRPAPVHRQCDGTSQCKIRCTLVQLVLRTFARLSRTQRGMRNK